MTHSAAPAKTTASRLLTNANTQAVTTEQQATPQQSSNDDYNHQANSPEKATTAATASPEWRTIRDRYIGHLMACKACYAPTDRHCATGANLRQQYNNTPMELAP